MAQMNDEMLPRLDALLPPEMALQAEEIGVKKANMNATNLFALAVLAGAFIAIGGMFATTLTAGAAGMPYGVGRLLAGLAFSTGLIMVVVGGAELFTGNNLIVMAFASGKVSLGALLRNWVIVYTGNFAGAVLTAVVVFIGRQHTYGHGAIGLNILEIGEAKTHLGFLQAVALGALCNALVCMAVWMCFGARTVSGKILAIIAPITAFVAASQEHSVANMYFIPLALLVKNFGDAQFFASISKTAADFPHLGLIEFAWDNLVPVTIGNIIGGAGMIGSMYWFIYRRGVRGASRPANQAP
jgi:formate transporter